MRKRLVAVAATAMLGLSASSADAQVLTTITIGPVAVYSGGSIGNSAWKVGSSAALGSSNLTEFVAYCFDPDRFISVQSNKYYALTFNQFLAGTGAGPGGAPALWNTITANDLNSMIASITGDDGSNGGNGYVLDAPLYDGATNLPSVHAVNAPIQQRIWDLADNSIQGNFLGDINAYSNSWMVLVDAAEWDRGLDGQRGLQGQQSFLIEVPGGGLITPEPSTYALMAAGLAGIGILARRRRPIA